MTSQQMMDYKSIDSKYRQMLLPEEKEMMIREKLFLTNKLLKLVSIGITDASSDLTNGFIHIIRNKLKLVIYIHNGDLRNIVKYYCKHKKMARDFIEFVEELVEQNRETEGNYLRVCNFLGREVNNYQPLIDKSIEDYMDFIHNSDLSKFSWLLDVFA